MKTPFAIVISTILAVVVPNLASATTRICSSVITILSGSETDTSSNAHVLELDITNCSLACSPSGFSNKRAYIEFGDKQLYAMALAAAAAGTSHGVAFDDASTSKGNVVHQNYPCKVLSIWK